MRERSPAICRSAGTGELRFGALYGWNERTSRSSSPPPESTFPTKVVRLPPRSPVEQTPTISSLRYLWLPPGPGFLRRNELSFSTRSQPCWRGYFRALFQKPVGQSGKSSLSDGSVYGIMSIAGAQDGEQGHSMFFGNFIGPVHDGEIEMSLFRLQQAPVTGGLRISPVPN